MTKLMADQGAEVIRIESGIRPDVLRKLPPFAESQPGLNRSGYFSNRNTNKKSICLDLSKEKAREVAKKIIEKSDVVANSFGSGVMEKWGFSYEDVKEWNPSIIYVSMPMQGNTGPHKQYIGFGATMNALIGFNHLTGLPDREPIGSGTNYPDHVPNPAHTLFAVLAALRYRKKTGLGQHIEVSQVESALSTLAIPVMDYLNNRNVQQRKGNIHENYAPYGVYPCAGEDRWVAISIYTDTQWETLCREINREDLLGQDKFATSSNRATHREEVDKIVASWTHTRAPEEVMQVLQQHSIAAGIVQNAKDLVETDPQLKHREHWVYLDHPEMGKSIYQSSPYKLSKTPNRLDKAAPILGEDTESICRDLLEFADDKYEQLKEEGIFQ